MDTLESLRRQLETADQLRLVVRVMKSLAAASIRQFERAAHAMTEYRGNVESALTVALHGVDTRAGDAVGIAGEEGARGRNIGAIVIGSDQGMCGRFNDHVAIHAAGVLRRTEGSQFNPTVIAVGARAAARLADAGVAVLESLRSPSAADAIAGVVQDLLVRIDRMGSQQSVGTVVVVFNEHVPGSGFEPRDLRLLPIDRAWMAGLQERPWPSRVHPVFTIERQEFLRELLREYLFTSLYLALASSLASEHASRLASMQAAQRNIEERLESLKASHRERRQADIDMELMDIIGGFEALSGSRGS
jgi:F-type H+-transporting ATPase subunit gamma